jgi:hypothetical protein
VSIPQPRKSDTYLKRLFKALSFQPATRFNQCQLGAASLFRKMPSAALSDDDVVNFYRANIYSLSQSSRETGEVPQRFRENMIELSVSARNMPRLPRFPKSSKFYARVRIKYPTDSSYSTILTTESCELETFPSFIKKAWIPALDMSNSQKFAANTLIRIDLFSCRTRIGHVTATLAGLLWRDSTCLVVNKASILPFLSKLVDEGAETDVILTVESYTRNSISMNSVLDRSHPSPTPSMVSLRVGATAMIRSSADSKKLTYSISRANYGGDWTVVHRSEALGRLKNVPSTEFALASISRDELLAGEEHRQLRIALHSFDRHNGSRMQGFAIARLVDFARILKERNDGIRETAILPWIRVGNAFMDATVQIHSAKYEGNELSARLMFKHGREAIPDRLSAAPVESSSVPPRKRFSLRNNVHPPYDDSELNSTAESSEAAASPKAARVLSMQLPAKSVVYCTGLLGRRRHSSPACTIWFPAEPLADGTDLSVVANPIPSISADVLVDP